MLADTVVVCHAPRTFYDPVRRCVVDGDGNEVTPYRASTLAELSEMPGPLAVLDQLYICEEASEETIRMLATVAGESVATLEARRHDWKEPPMGCPAVVPTNRRRCWKCPRWQESDATPF